MTEEQQKEQFGIAYVCARLRAATAKINIYRLEVDEDSIDIGFSVKSVAGRSVPPKLDAQLKCVTDLKREKGFFHYPLKIKNYNPLSSQHQGKSHRKD